MTQRSLLSGPGGSLFVDDGGSGGVAVVFVHALAGNTSHWESQLAHLRPERRALALDLRGHGRSAPATPPDYSVDAFAADLAAVIEERRLERFVLAGHSLGASACIAYAAQRPKRVAGLFLLDPATDARQVPKEMTARLLRDLRSSAYLDAIEAYWEPMLHRSNAGVRQRVLGDLHATSHTTVIETLAAAASFDPVTSLRSYSGPKLCVITPDNRSSLSLPVLVPELPSTQVDSFGHWLQLDAPDIVNARLDEFLAEID
jgi:pimeloyl-ACP methyl ester carboxylesterase